MNYYLMHKDDKVLALDIYEPTGTILDYEVLMEEKKPAYIDNIQNMNYWWSARAIPKSRSGINQILKRNGIDTTETLMLKNMALNLSDCYWVRSVDSDIRYDDVNFFDNVFEKVDFGSDLSVAEEKKMKSNMLSSPSGSLNGQMPKYWEVNRRTGERVLVKKAIGIKGQHQALNEVFAYEFHKKIGRFNSAEYWLSRSNGVIKDVRCGSFATKDMEYIPLAYIASGQQINATDARKTVRAILDALEALGVPRDAASSYFSYLHLTDFLISNTDRHLNNYGILRDSNTLKAIGFAPIFDNGNSMLYDTLGYWGFDEFRRLKTKAFGIFTNDKKLLMAGKAWYDKLDLDALPSAEQVCEFYGRLYSGGDRRNAENIASAYAYKLRIFERIRAGEALYDILKNKDLLKGLPFGS